jgi:hypothetical protein
MKRSSRIHQYIKRFGPLLIVGILIMGLASCDGSCSSAPAEYELNTSSSGGGEVVIPGEGTYADGTVVMLEAVADECYEFVKWTGANVTDPYSPITTITMDEAKSITAHFALLSYDLTVSSTDGGAVTSPGEDTYTYDCGTVVALVAAAQEGYYFVNWSSDVDTVANTNAPTTTITMMGNYSITANFELIPPGQFVLTTSSTAGGSITTPGEGTFPYDEDTVVDLVAEAEECYEFVNWTGDTVANPNSATTTIIMDGAKHVTANFALISYNLTADSTDGGEVTSPGEGTFPYDCGTVVDLVAEADECYEFVNWTGDTVANPNSATTTITMDGAKHVTANFALISYNLTADSTDGGEVTSPGEGTFPYDCGTVVDLLAEPEEGYSFVKWSGDVGTIADTDAAETTITMNGHYSITANFGFFAGGNGTAEDPYEITDWYSLDNLRNYLSSHFILINDLDSNSAGYPELASATANEGKGWQPIGNTTENGSFTGSFDGQGYEICDLFIDRDDENQVGLFGVVDKGGILENVGVVNGNVTGSVSVGGLVGLVGNGTVSDSYATGSVIGNKWIINGGFWVGGLVGSNEGTVSNSYSTCNVTGYWGVGGLMGRNEGTVSNSSATGSVDSWIVVGGLVGVNDNAVNDCYSTGNVFGFLFDGGLVGVNHDTVSNSFWDTETSGQATSAGGIGKNTTEMKDITTFSGAGWDIIAVANPSIRNPSYIWNIIDTVTYPFLSWQSV